MQHEEERYSHDLEKPSGAMTSLTRLIVAIGPIAARAPSGAHANRLTSGNADLKAIGRTLTLKENAGSPMKENASGFIHCEK
jgi:hypothetical protein